MFIPPKSHHTFTFVIMLIFLPIFKVTTSFCFWYGNKNMSKKREGGWSGIGMATVGIDPTNFGILNDHPPKIPPGELLGGVVKNCQDGKDYQKHQFEILIAHIY